MNDKQQEQQEQHMVELGNNQTPPTLPAASIIFVTPERYQLTPSKYICVDPYSNARKNSRWTCPAPYKATRALLEQRKEQRDDFNERGAVNDQVGYHVKKPLMVMFSLKEICRSSYLATIPTARLSREESFALLHQRLLDLGENVLTQDTLHYLEEGCASFFHHIPNSAEPKLWSELMRHTDFAMLVNNDVQACSTCLRGSRNPHNNCIRTNLLFEENSAWSPYTNVFGGTYQSYFLCWTCSADCYWALKGGAPVLSIAGIDKVAPYNDPPSFFFTNDPSPSIHVSYSPQANSVKWI